MANNAFTRMGESVLVQGGNTNFRSDSSQSNRNIYPAIVRIINDLANQNRIKAEIVSIDNQGNVQPGKDKDTPVDKLPVCIPFETEILHVRPQIGEMVWVITENPNDLTSVRYWKGPVFTSQLNLPFQTYSDAFSIYNTNTFGSVTNTPNQTQQNPQVIALLPQPSEIALQGRNDANITLRPREIVIRAGSFIKGTTNPNTTHPCEIHLNQFDDIPNSTGLNIMDKLLSNKFVPFSQQNIIATNINLISTEGKNRTFSQNTPEATTNPRLLDLGALAQQLHPLVYGDELIKILSYMLQYMANHIHTPQSPPLPNPTSELLDPYLNGTKLQDLISNFVRTN